VTDPISKSLLQFWPVANTTPAGGSTINYIANVGSTTFDWTGLVRVDYRITDKDQLTVRWAEYSGRTFTPGALPLLGGNANLPVSYSDVIDYTHTFSPRFMNEVRLGFSRNQTLRFRRFEDLCRRERESASWRRGCRQEPTGLWIADHQRERRVCPVG
jgi:hypothetical protein